MNKKNIVERIIPHIFWIIMWSLVAWIINEELFFPSPLTTFEALKDLVVEKYFLISIISTIGRVFLGLLIANILGIGLGLICGLNDKVFILFRPFITMVRSTPVMSLIIIALIWFKSGNVPIFISFLMCFPIIWTNIVEGFKKVDDKLLEMAKIYKVDKAKVIKEIYIPSLIPFYIAGFNLSLGIAWKVTVAAEVLSHPRFSIGKNLYDSKVYLDTPSLFAWTSVIVILSFIFEVLITNYLENKLEKYY